MTVPIAIDRLAAPPRHASVGLVLVWPGHEEDDGPSLDGLLGSMCFYYRTHVRDPYRLWRPKRSERWATGAVKELVSVLPSGRWGRRAA